MAKKNDIKTNAMRILEKNKISYDAISYEVDEFVDGVHCSEISGAPVEESYKTLVMRGKSNQFYVFVIPVAGEVDLKAAARAAGEKSVEMIHVKELTPITGYVRGGCSPLGMKKQFPTIIDASAESLEQFYVSGGKIGLTLHLAVSDLQKVTRAVFADVVRK